MVRWLPGCCYAVTLFWTVDIVGCLPAHVKKASNKPNSLTIRPQLRNIKTLEQRWNIRNYYNLQKKMYIYMYIYIQYIWAVCELPSLQDIYIMKARRIIKDSSHLTHRLLSLLPSGRHLCSIRSRTSRLRDSFFPQAIRTMSSQNYDTLQHTPTLWYAMHCTLTFTQLNWTTQTHFTSTTIYPLPLDTMQCTSMTLHIRMMYNMLHLLILLCVFMFT